MTCQVICRPGQLYTAELRIKMWLFRNLCISQTHLYGLLKQSAEINRRSINSEIIICIEKAVSSRQVEIETVLARAREIRGRTKNHLLTEDEIAQAKIVGRQ